MLQIHTMKCTLERVSDAGGCGHTALKRKGGVRGLCVRLVSSAIEVQKVLKQKTQHDDTQPLSELEQEEIKLEKNVIK